MFLVLLWNSTFLETKLCVEQEVTSGAENEAEWTLNSKTCSSFSHHLMSSSRVSHFIVDGLKNGTKSFMFFNNHICTDNTSVLNYLNSVYL